MKTWFSAFTVSMNWKLLCLQRFICRYLALNSAVPLRFLLRDTMMFYMKKFQGCLQAHTFEDDSSLSITVH